MPVNTAHKSTGRKANKRRSVNLTIREGILRHAKTLRLNASQAAEAGIVEAVRKKQEEEWLAANREAILAHNKRIDGDGPLLTHGWAAEK